MSLSASRKSANSSMHLVSSDKQPQTQMFSVKTMPRSARQSALCLTLRTPSVSYRLASYSSLTIPPDRALLYPNISSKVLLIEIGHFLESPPLIMIPPVALLQVSLSFLAMIQKAFQRASSTQISILSRQIPPSQQQRYLACFIS